MTTPLPTLAAGRLVLRPWQESDAADLEREIQDPDIVRWLDIELPYTIADATSFIQGAASQWEQQRAAHFVIAESGTGRFLGYVAALALGDDLSSAELVYWVCGAARRRGVASTAVATILTWLVESVGTSAVELGMIDGNVASARVAEANGFVLHEIVRSSAMRDGVPVDERIYRRDASGLERT